MTEFPLYEIAKAHREPLSKFAAYVRDDGRALDDIQNRRLAQKANIAIRRSDVGATTDRTWRGTKYVSRSKGSLWVRKEMPSSLKPFLKEDFKPDMDTALAALGFEDPS